MYKSPQTFHAGKLYKFIRKNPEKNFFKTDYINFIQDDNSTGKVIGVPVDSVLVFVKKSMHLFYEHVHFLLPEGVIAKIGTIHLKDITVRYDLYLEEVKDNV